MRPRVQFVLRDLRMRTLVPQDNRRQTKPQRCNPLIARTESLRVGVFRKLAISFASYSRDTFRYRKLLLERVRIWPFLNRA